MKKNLTALLSIIITMNACNTNPLLEESALEYGAPQFDKIKAEHYLPAFKKGIEERLKNNNNFGKIPEGQEEAYNRFYNKI